MHPLFAQKRFLTLLFTFVFLTSLSPGAVLPTRAAQPLAQPGKFAPISPEVLNRLGISHPAGANMTALSQQAAAQAVQKGLPKGPVNPLAPTSAGLPSNLSFSSAFSSLIMTNVTGNGRFNEVDLMGDLDGREDLNADHSIKVNDIDFPLAGWSLTRTAISEHTIANGFNSNIFYYGDTFGNVFITANFITATIPAMTMAINLPTELNAFGTLNSDDQVVITGLAISPVADLTSFSNVNGSFVPFNGLTGEILYVTFWDTGSGLRLNFNGDVIRSGLLAFPIADIPSPASAPPGVVSNLGYPVMVGGAFGVAFSTFSNLAGVAVDDDGSAYFQQVDLVNFTGANIVKIESLDSPNGPTPFQDRSLATSGFVSLGNTLNPLHRSYGTSSGPAKQINKATNYSGTSTTFGNIVALATGPNNVLYAALARSFVPTDDPATQATEGLFSNDPRLGPTPSMIISFADTSGAFDVCSAPIPGKFPGSIPVADGLADVAAPGLLDMPGLDNFRVFALGTGPDIRSASSIIGASPDNTQQVAFQEDYTVYSGLAVDEENKVYVVSGGTPAGVGNNPSPNLGEVLLFPDSRPYDRRADYVDLRGEIVPTPANTLSTNTGNGISDRYDHIFWQAPLDQISVTPAGISGLARGFLLYLNRTRDNAAFFPTLPNGTTQALDSSNGPIPFEWFDPGHQVAGGDDQNFPFTGDDSDGGGNAALTHPLDGGFEFVCAGGGANCTKPLNTFYLNSNGSLTLSAGDPNGTPASGAFLLGDMKIAPAWSHLDTGSRGTYSNTFPVQAVGFAGINDFKVRWINTPEAGKETCGSQNSFSASLFDDGTGIDENANQPLNPANPIGNNAVAFDHKEGPTALIYYVNPNLGKAIGQSPRRDGSGYILFDYGRMDLLGTPASPVLVGYSVGGLTVPVAQTNLGESARTIEAKNPQDPALWISTPASLYETFSTGVPATITVSGGITTVIPAAPAFDLRVEGNSSQLSTPVGQADQNRANVLMVNFLGTHIYAPLVTNEP